MRPALSSLSRLNALRSASTTKNKPETHTQGSHRNLIIKLLHDFSMTSYAVSYDARKANTEDHREYSSHTGYTKRKSLSSVSALSFSAGICCLDLTFKKVSKKQLPNVFHQFLLFYVQYIYGYITLYLWESNH